MGYSFDHAIGRNIRKLRSNKKITQDQLTARLQILGCDMTRSALAKIEAGQRHIYAHEIKALKEALDVPYERLFE
ncbi:MAG: helix-turn-helix domain-containing protein [Christensenellales bacterium]